MWNDRDLEEQYMPDHLMNHVLKQNGVEHGGHHEDGHHPASLHHVDSNRHMGPVDMMDPMLGHIGDQVVNVCRESSQYIGMGRLPGLPWCIPPPPRPRHAMHGMLNFNAWNGFDMTGCKKSTGKSFFSPPTGKYKEWLDSVPCQAKRL